MTSLTLPPAPLAVFSSPDEASLSVFPTPRPTLPTTPPRVFTVPPATPPTPEARPEAVFESEEKRPPAAAGFCSGWSEEVGWFVFVFDILGGLVVEGCGGVERVLLFLFCSDSGARVFGSSRLFV